MRNILTLLGQGLCEPPPQPLRAGPVLSSCRWSSSTSSVWVFASAAARQRSERHSFASSTRSAIPPRKSSSPPCRRRNLPRGTKFVNPDKTNAACSPSADCGDDSRPEIQLRAGHPPDQVAASRHLGLHLKIRHPIRAMTSSARRSTACWQKTIFSNAPNCSARRCRRGQKQFLGDPKMSQFNSAVAGASPAPSARSARNQRDLEQGNFGLEELAPARAGGRDIFSRLGEDRTPKQVVGSDVKSPQPRASWAATPSCFCSSPSQLLRGVFRREEHRRLPAVLSSPVSRASCSEPLPLPGAVRALSQLLALFFAGHLLYGVDVFGPLRQPAARLRSVAAAMHGLRHAALADHPLAECRPQPWPRCS